MNKVVGIGEYAISVNPEDIITTHALASCVAVTAYSSSKKVAGMVHIMLPSPSQGQKDSSGPYYYAVTGIPLMINKMCSEYGCLKSDLKIKLFGAADSIRVEDVFKLGKKNKQTVEKVLKDMNLHYDSSKTGGVLSRTLEMDVATGNITIKSQPITI